jgi:hypothetical protein
VPILAASLVIALVLVGNGLVAAQSPMQYYGGPGGEITGIVIGVDKIPVDWALVYAKSAEHTFQTFSGMSGVYQMRVPVGIYNVTVNVPGFRANSASVNVTLNSSTTVNFHLERSDVPVPEFQSDMALVVIVLTFAVALIFRRHTSNHP